MDDREWTIRRGHERAPGIYVRILADMLGRSPTSKQIKLVVKRLRAYIWGDPAVVDDVVALDNVRNSKRSTQASILAFQHFHIQGLASRVSTILTWCKAMETQIQALPAEFDRSAPFPRSLNYVGCSKPANSEFGLDPYRNSSMWLLELVADAFHVEFEDAFAIHDFVVCFLADKEEEILGKIALTAMAYAKVVEGGFCVASSGETSSATSGMGEEDWTMCKRFRAFCTPYEKNLEAEAKRLDFQERYPLEDIDYRLPYTAPELAKDLREVREEGRVLQAELEEAERRKKSSLEKLKATIKETEPTLGCTWAEWLADCPQALAIVEAVRDNKEL